MPKIGLKMEKSKKRLQKLKSFLRNFKNPIAEFFKVFYNNSTVVKSGAKCSEIPQKAYLSVPSG